MKREKYYLGLDIRTDSVGYAVSREDYSLCKFHGEPMWGTTLFETANQRKYFSNLNNNTRTGFKKEIKNYINVYKKHKNHR